MYLYITHLIPKIADKDIICYKHVKRTKIKGVYVSSIKRFEYVIRQSYINHTDIKYTPAIIKHIQVANYSFLNYIEEGMFHSYYLPTMSVISSNYAVLKCIIPKGAYYFKGHSNNILCYASSQIKILEEIKI